MMTQFLRPRLSVLLGSLLLLGSIAPLLGAPPAVVTIQAVDVDRGTVEVQLTNSGEADRVSRITVSATAVLRDQSVVTFYKTVQLRGGQTMMVDLEFGQPVVDTIHVGLSDGLDPIG